MSDPQVCAYCGLTAVGNAVKYQGPLNPIELDGGRIDEFVRVVLGKQGSAHLVVLPQLGLVIVVRSRDDFMAIQFTSPMSELQAQSFLNGAIARGEKIRLLEEYGAFEIGLDQSPPVSEICADGLGQLGEDPAKCDVNDADLEQLRALVSAGETFRAVKLFVKLTGASPTAGRKYVDDLAGQMAIENDGVRVDARREATIVGSTLEEAQEKLEALVRSGSVLISSKIVNKGERRVTQSGSTLDEAFAKAQRKLSSGETIVRRTNVAEPAERSTTVRASDSDDARLQVEKTLAAGEKVVRVTETAVGKRPFLGLGRVANEYLVDVRTQKAIVEVVAACDAEIHAVLAEKRSKSD